MNRREYGSQHETTPLLSHNDSADVHGTWLLARRRSSAFLSFLSQPEDKDADEYLEWRRKRSLYLIIGLITLNQAGIGILNSFGVDLIQTLTCAEYYYAAPNRPMVPNLPAAGDPSDLCSVAYVDKRTSQVSTYTDALGSLTSIIASLVLAQGIFPRFSRRTIGMFTISITLAFSICLTLIPTHYSFEVTVPSTSTIHPTTALNLVVALYVVGGLFGAPQTAMPLLAQVMVLDVCRDDEKTSAFAQIYAANALGMGISSLLLRLILLFFRVEFSILHHQGPFSPFWMVVITIAITTLLVILFLPETKPKVAAKVRTRQSSFSSDGMPSGSVEGTAEGQRPTSAASLSKPRCVSHAVLQILKETLGLLSYLVPYRPSPEAKRDYNLTLILCAVIFSDTITLVWGNLVVFCSTHLHFGPKEVTTLLGLLASKGLFSLFCLPFIVKAVHRIVKTRLRQELLAASVDDFAIEMQIVKREESVVKTDTIIAIGSLGADCVGFVAMGIAASHLSPSGIYASKY